VQGPVFKTGVRHFVSRVGSTPISFRQVIFFLFKERGMRTRLQDCPAIPIRAISGYQRAYLGAYLGQFSGAALPFRAASRCRQSRFST
jgi:hypothetical protein